MNQDLRKALYFPYISLPNDGWLNQALLYWDELASIVPVDYINNPIRHDPHMRSLVEEGLVSQIQPGMYIGDHDKFNNLFISIAEKDSIFEKTAKKVKKGENVSYTPIHMNKLGYLGNYLVELDVAWKNNSEWYLVESKIAEIFMTFLTVQICENQSYEPLTRNDITFKGKKRKAFRSIVGKARVAEQQLNIQEYISMEFQRDRILAELLPAPLSMPSAIEIKRFKENNHKELMRFRTRIEDFILEHSRYSSNIREQLTSSFINEMLEERRIIECKMNNFGWKYVDYYDLGVTLLNTGIITASTDFTSKSSVLISGCSLAINLANQLRSIRKERKAVEGLDMVYSVNVGRL